MNQVDVAIIGGGNMGAALLGGMLVSGEFEATSLAVVEQLPARRDELVEMFPDVTVVSDVPPCTGAVIAVKPQGVADAVRDAVSAGARRIVSIAAGVTLASLDTAAGPGVAVVRAMPNTPALVGRGAAAIAGGATASDDDLAWAEAILGSVGIVERLDESLLDAFTGVAGSGPAYIFLFAEALIDAAVARANSRLPDYARVRRWALAAEPFTFTNGSLTANGRLRRGQILREHAQTLDWLYREPATAEEFCT